MGVKQYKPTSPGRRFQTVSDFAEITTSKPEKSLLAPKPKKAGRNNNGRITTRHQGGGTKQRYRIIDFKRNKDGVPAKVATIEYDPNRSARIALLHYVDGEKRYIIHPKGLKVGDMVMSGPEADIKPGNALPLANIPVGTLVHNVELQPGKGAAIARSAGTSIQLMGKEGNYAILRMPSSEMRRVLITCRATIGEVGNAEHSNIKVGKAGRNRWKGIRPSVRGTVMNPVDHPHGGGEGKNKSATPRRPPAASSSVVARSSAEALRSNSEQKSEKGSFRRAAPSRPYRGYERGRRKERHQDLVSCQHHLPGHGGPHHRRARWPQARAGLRYRIHGRPQAGRVRAYAYLQGSFRRQGQAIG